MSDLSLPVELLGLIFDQFVAECSRRDLSSLSLSCQTFLPWCRKHKFSSIRLTHDKGNTTAISEFSLLVDANPIVAQYVRKLEFYHNSDTPDNIHAPPLLNRLTVVEDLLLDTRGHKTILRMEPRLRASFVNLIASPQLKCLSLACRPTPYQVSSFCNPGLEHLILKCVYLYEASSADLQWLSELNTPRFDNRIRLTSLEPGPHFSLNDQKLVALIFDLSSLKSLTMTTYARKGRDNLSSQFPILRAPEKLDSLKIISHRQDIFDSFAGLSKVLKPSILSTLQRLSLSNYVQGGVDPYADICNELMPLTNLQELYLGPRVDVRSYHRLGDDWGKLDDVIFKTHNWKPLRLTMVVSLYAGGNQEFEARIKQIPELHLSRISKKENIDFSFSIVPYMFTGMGLQLLWL